MNLIKLEDVNPHGISAVVQQGNGVIVRYSDGKEEVRIDGVTTSQVMKHMSAVKNRADSTD